MLVYSGCLSCSLFVKQHKTLQFDCLKADMMIFRCICLIASVVSLHGGVSAHTYLHVPTLAFSLLNSVTISLTQV